MTVPHLSLNRRSFLKRLGSAVGVFSATSVFAPRIPAGADVPASDITATAEDMTNAERYAVVHWSGPADAQVQLRQLQLFGRWTAWADAPRWSDAEDSTVRKSGLVRTNGAQAVQARSLTPGATDLVIVRVNG